MGDLPGHEFHGNQYTTGGGQASDARHPHDAAKHKAETSTEHTGLEHLKKEHPIKEIYHAIASIADDVASAIENL